MLNIPELERRWLQYKIKSYIPYLTITISLIIIFALGAFFYSNEENIPVAHVEKKATQIIDKQPVKQEVKRVIKEKVVQPTIITATSNNAYKETTDKKQEITPSLDFMKRMQDSVQPYYINEEMHEEVHTVVSEREKRETSIAPIEEKVIQTISQSTPTKISIKREDTKNDIRDIIKRFKKNNNPTLSLFVAKKSYELGDYKQAYNYALITNKINSDIESSWIVFAKSLVKLGKKEKAITTLKKYISYSNSDNAKILLDNINSGKFR